MEIYLVDAFTTERFKGNSAGVVLDADRLSSEQKQTIAREINASETAFVSKSDLANFKVDFFTPTTEIDFCGHATVATFHTLVSTGRIKLSNGLGNSNEETRVGIVPISLEERDKLIYATITQNQSQISTIPCAASDIAQALGIEVNEQDNNYPLLFSNTGNCHLMVGVKRQVLDRIKYNSEKLSFNIDPSQGCDCPCVCARR